MKNSWKTYGRQEKVTLLLEDLYESNGYDDREVT